MQLHPLLRRTASLLLAITTVLFLADCTRIDSRGQPVDQPITSTHVSPPGPPAR